MSAGPVAPAQESGSWLARHFDDLEVGASVRTGGRTITEADVVAFSSMTGDRIALDADARAGDGPAAARGMLVLAYGVGLLPIDPSCVLAMREVRDVVFRAPVTVGTTIYMSATVDQLAPIDETAGLVRWRVAISTDSGETVADGRLGALWRRSA
jgi:3-hydroxybutyryl-CoA dehydratase